MPFKVVFNDRQIAEVRDDLKSSLVSDLQKALENIAQMTMAKATEFADERLNSRRSLFKENLSLEKIDDNFWMVTLKAPAAWINDGVKGPYDMRDTLLKRGYKTSKEGHRYRSIPFNQAKAPQDLTPKGKEMLDLVKKELKSRNIPYKKIEYNADGSPKIGKLHSLNINSPRPTAAAKYPALQGLTIYQRKTASGKVERDIMTFRTISEKDAGKSWINPGVSPTKIMEDTAKWMQDEFEKTVLPAILEGYK